MSKKFIVIGITDATEPFFPPEILLRIRQGRIFSGGKRHHEIVANLLPKDAIWINITVPLDGVFKQYRQFNDEIIVFASGDPLFFGFANTIRRVMPEAKLEVYPTFNSLQLLAHRLLMPYHDMHIVSLTGRPWPAFDNALIERNEKIGILTDREHTPATIASRMLEYGYKQYTMYVGEHLGNPSLEQVTTLTLEEAAQKTFEQPNCIILKTHEHLSAKPFGIPESTFTLLDGREKMITKMPIRLLTLQSLELPRRQVMWDIGFCTGSISIEARLQFPHLTIVAFEIRQECEAIIHENTRRFGAPGIQTVMGDFLEADLSSLPRPDAVFIGGHGGHLQEILKKILTVLSPDGCIVFNSVKSPKVQTDSRQLWEDACQSLCLQQAPPLHIQLNDHNPIDILKAFPFKPQDNSQQ